MSTGPRNPERPRDQAEQFAEMHRDMRIESPADTVIGANQNLFNRYYRSLIGMGMSAGEERTDVADPVDRQALKTLSAFEAGRPVNQHDTATTRRDRFDAWLYNLAGNVGVRMLPEDLYPVLLGRPVIEADQIFATQEAFEEAVKRAYRSISHLSEEMIVSHWVGGDLLGAEQNWPVSAVDRRRRFNDVFVRIIQPTIRDQWDRDRSITRAVPTQQDFTDAEFNRRAEEVRRVMERRAERAQTVADVQRLFHTAAQGLALAAFAAEPQDLDAVARRSVDARHRDREMTVNHGNWAAPLPYAQRELRSAAAPRPVPEAGRHADQPTAVPENTTQPPVTPPQAPGAAPQSPVTPRTAPVVTPQSAPEAASATGRRIDQPAQPERPAGREQQQRNDVAAVPTRPAERTEQAVGRTQQSAPGWFGRRWAEVLNVKSQIISDIQNHAGSYIAFGAAGSVLGLAGSSALVAPWFPVGIGLVSGVAAAKFYHHLRSSAK